MPRRISFEPKHLNRLVSQGGATPQVRELAHIAALDIARQRAGEAKPKPLIIRCRVCGNVPRSKGSAGRYTPTADGRGYTCPLHRGRA